MCDQHCHVLQFDWRFFSLHFHLRNNMASTYGSLSFYRSLTVRKHYRQEKGSAVTEFESVSTAWF